MTGKKDIGDFLELMDHEFPDIKLSVNRSGYKVDGNNGIKKHCKLNTLKSVDYFCEHGVDFLLVEFSDLARQQSGIIDEIATLKATNLDKNFKKRLVVEAHKKIQKELVAKYKDSIHILGQIDKHLDHIPAVLLGEGGNGGQSRAYVIVVAPIDHSLAAEKKVELVRFLDNLKDKVSQSIPDAIYRVVKVQPVAVFAD